MFVDTVKKTFWTIDEKNFRELAGRDVLFAAQYFLVLLLFGTALQMGLYFIQSFNVIGAAFGAAFIMITYGFGIGILLPVVSHALVKLLGGKSTLKEMFNIYFFASTPSLLLSWLPCIGGLSPLVSFGNVFRGVREINNFPFWKPLIAVLLPSLIYWGAWILAIVGLMKLASP